MYELFDVNAAILAYVEQNHMAPEHKIIRAVELLEEQHHEARGIDTFTCADVSLVLFKLVQAKRLEWHEPPGGDASGTKSLLYSIPTGPK